MMNKIKGFVFEHEKDDWSLWIGGISDEDQATINAVLEKYANWGYSVRGKDVREDIEKIMEG